MSEAGGLTGVDFTEGSTASRGSRQGTTARVVPGRDGGLTANEGNQSFEIIVDELEGCRRADESGLGGSGS